MRSIKTCELENSKIFISIGEQIFIHVTNLEARELVKHISKCLNEEK